MERLNSVKCTACGAALPVRLNATSVKCAFCGGTRPIEPGELSVQREALGKAVDAENECLRAMRKFVEHGLAPRMFVIVFVLFGLMFGIPAFAFSFCFWFESRFPQDAWYVTPFFGFGGGVGGFAASIFGVSRFVNSHHEKTETVYATLRKEARAHPERGRCPQCGGSVQVPPLTAALDCAFCDAPLVAAEGILIRWVEDASARSKSWQDKSREAFEAHMRDTDFSNRLPVRELAAAFVVMAAVLLIMGYGSRLYETVYQWSQMMSGKPYSPTW